MQLRNILVLAILATVSSATLSAADRYWVSATSKNWSDASAWSATAGGAGGATVPESGDRAFFGSYGAGNCSITASITVDRIEIASNYGGVVIQNSSVTVMTGSFDVNGTFRMGTNGKLQLTDSDTPLTGTGTLDTSTNTPNTVEYRGGDDVGIASAAPVTSYSNLTLTPPGGISRAGIFVGNSNEQYFDMAAVDAAAGFLYVGSKNAPAKIVKIRLSDYTHVGTLTLASGENDLSPAVVVDSANGYLYAGTRTTPAKIVKIRLSDFTRVGAITLNSGENQLWAATLDAANGFAYFGARTSPGIVVKIRLSDFTRDSALTLASGENEVLGACIDPAAGFAYFGLQTYPGKVVKVQLSDFTKVGTLTFNSGEDRIRVGVIDPVAGYAYWGTRTSPGKVVRVRLSDFTRDSALTLNTGENELYSGVIDTAGGNAYFGTYTNPGTVVKVKLADFTRADAVTLGFGEKYLDTAAIDASAGFAYFMTDNWTGKSMKINLNHVSATWTHATPLDVNGNLSIGAGTLDSEGQSITLAGNWSNTGTFNTGLNTVTLDGGNQTVSGNNTFRNLTKTVTSASTLTFESGKLQQVAGTLNLQGISGQLLTICSSTAGQPWRLAAENYQTSRFASIKDTNASEGRALIALSSTDAGNNQNVVFTSPAQISITTPNTSATSPAWVEGTNGGDAFSVTVAVNSGTSFNAVRLSPTKWFADNASSGGASLGVTLSPTSATHVEVTASNPFSNSNTAAQDITWTATDLKDKSFSSDTVRIRKGDSLLLTATGAGATLQIDGHDDGTYEHSGVPGQEFPTVYNTAGSYIARAKIDGVEIGSLTVVVVEVNIGLIICQVNFQRVKSVAVTPATEAANFCFSQNDAYWAAVSLKSTTASGADVYVNPLRRGSPALEVRLGTATGPMVAWSPVDEFTLDVPARHGTLFDADTNVGTTKITMHPYIAGAQFDFSMFSSQSTFAGGATSIAAFTSTDFTQMMDPATGEIVGEYLLDIEMPNGESKYCFDISIKNPPVPVGHEGTVNGGGCKAKVNQIYFCAADTAAKKLVVELTSPADKGGTKHRIEIVASAGVPTEAHFPNGPDAKKINSKVEVDCAQPTGTKFEEDVLPGTNPVGKKYNVKIDGTVFSDRIIVVSVKIVCTHALLQSEAAPTTGVKFTLEFSPSDAAAAATAYAWKVNYVTPNINGPSFPYTTANQKETGVSDFKWYGHGNVPDDDFGAPNGGESDGTLRWIGNCMSASAYELLCDVTLPGSVVCTASLKAGTGSTGKYFYVTVMDAGSTLPASLLNVTLVQIVQDGAIWKITGKGAMIRQPSVITQEPPTASQFYNKTHTHEEVHKSEWETVEAGVPKYFNVDTFYARIKDFTGTSKIELQNKVVADYNKFLDEQHAALKAQFGTLREREKRAYHAEYDVEPKGVRERSDTWIDAQYPE